MRHSMGMKLELKIPPLALAVALALLCWLFVQLLPGLRVWFGYSPLLAVLLMLLGGGIGYSAILAVTQAETTVNPLHPEQSRHLVTGGIYRLSRNPMYLGMALVLAGVGVFCGSLLVLGAVPFFVWYITRYQIMPEEKALHDRFSRAYDAYRQHTRRWI